MTQLLIFFILAISINSITLKMLVGLLIALTIALAFTKNRQFLPAILRFKWFFLVMMIIFAFNTPGEHVSSWPWSISPSYEGITAGLIQILRIVLMLAALNLILACNTRQELISGFYFILLPLKYFGLQVERFVARLWLTLHYVELQNEESNQQGFLHQIKTMLVFKPGLTNQEINITVKIQQFSRLDFLTIALLLLVMYLFKVFV